MVMAWLLNPMQPKIGKPVLYLSTAKEIWEAMSKTYSKNDNVAQIYELKVAIHNTKQQDLSMIAYYNTLKVLW